MKGITRKNPSSAQSSIKNVIKPRADIKYQDCDGKVTFEGNKSDALKEQIFVMDSCEKKKFLASTFDQSGANFRQLFDPTPMISEYSLQERNHTSLII